MAEVDDWAPVGQQPVDDWQPVGSTPPTAPEQPQPSQGLLDRASQGLSAVGSYLWKGIQRYPSDVADIAKSGFEQSTGESSMFDDAAFGKNVEQQLIGVGRTPEQAKAEAGRLIDGWKQQERRWGFFWGGMQAITAPFFQAPIRSFGSAPLEEATGIPKEVSEGFGMVAAAGLGMRSLARVEVRGGKVTAQAIGDLPKDADFKTAADLITAESEPKGPPIVRFRREAGEYEQTLPPVSEGYTRLWRGNRPDEVGQNPVFTNDLPGIALPFREAYGGPLSYVDVPTKELAAYENKAGAASGAEFTLPADLAAKAQIVQRGMSIAEQNLRTLWEERGVHPAEALHEAQGDVWVKNELQQPPIEAFHGSPFDFDQFDFSKIGSGQGGRAFGHGIYFTEDQNVAGRFAVGDGTVYAANLKFDRGALLDWDKPIDQQSEAVRKAFSDMGVEEAASFNKKTRPIKWGADAYQEAVENLGAAEVSKRLADAGVPGITFTGEGTALGKSNFVVFSDKSIEITHKNGEPVVGKERADALEQARTPQPGGADVTRNPPPLVPLAQQPQPLPGRLATAARTATDQLLGLGQNIQFMLDPMATGSNRAMVIAKDAISTVRRIQWEHARVDAEITRRFTPEQWERMWNALDEESVLIQSGEKGMAAAEHMGINTLAQDERYFVEYIQGQSQAAWLHARDAGIVEGEGLPAYTPRMVLNVAAASDKMGPTALNELGRNVFTRTSQMRHRSNLTAEETEAAAKAMVEKQMRDRGASQAEIDAALEKVKIARNIRALPLATSRLETAAVWREMINKIEEIGKATGDQMVATGAAPAEGWFTIAGNPAFTKWEPALIKDKATGQWGVAKDDNGNVMFQAKPIYLPAEFKGPMSAILDEGPSSSKVVRGAHSAYSALMAIKGRAMQAILNSPLIHNEVVWGKVAEAAGGREWLGFGLYFRGNRIVNGPPARARELIERGLNPMGPRGAIQDITAMMEEPNVVAGHNVSWTGKLLGFITGLFDEGAGAAVERGIAKAGNFVHNTLLWDRVRDLQFGLADHLSDRLVAKGADRLTADRVASHFANIVVGSIPKEAMSAAARGTANLLLFSRSFTLGNLATYKQAALGLPKPILAQIERDFGISAEAALGEEAAASVKQTAQSMARRKAFSTLALSAGFFYAGNALLQHALDYLKRDVGLNDVLAGYVRRYQSFMKDVSQDPFELRHILARLSPTYDNEPQKQDRVHVGEAADGTAIYARNPVGKYGEEMVGYPTHPMTMLRSKLSPLAGGLLDILENDKGFGKKIYDEHDKTLSGDAATAVAVAKHLIMKHLPEQQIIAATDLIKGAGDATVNKLRLLGPAFGFSASVGAPGGPAKGEVYNVKDEFDARFNIAWPDIKKQIQGGDIDGARKAMDAIRVPPRMQNGLIRSTMFPSMLRGNTLRDFYQKATPDQIDRLERARQP